MAMVEFIIVFPIQLVFILGVMQLSLIYVGAIVVNQAAYSAARTTITADADEFYATLTPGERPAYIAARAQRTLTMNDGLIVGDVPNRRDPS